jgi:hypothetical protein
LTAIPIESARTGIVDQDRLGISRDLFIVHARYPGNSASP